MLQKNIRSKSNKTVIPLLPLRDIIIYPHMVVPLFVGRERSINSLEVALKQEKEILLVAQKNAKVDDPAEEEMYTTGTIGGVVQLIRLPDGTVKVLVEGRKRGKIKRFIPNDEYFMVEAEEVDEWVEVTSEVEALMRSVNSAFEAYVKLNKKIPPEILMPLAAIEDPARLADTVAAHLQLKIEDKQLILEIEDPTERLERIYTLMQSEIEILQIEHKIRGRVKKQMEKNQKDYYLNEQMKAIQKELGDKDEFRDELKELEERIASKKMSEEATEKAQKELKKLRMMAPMSAEGTVVRNYLEWLLSLPWYDKTTEKPGIEDAEKILDEDHYGLDRVKERIVEYLAVHSLIEKMKGPILCLVGPPGVGKTSLAKSIARSMGRKFVRISLGGVRDEAEIRGHRRTYIGALPGKIIQSMKKAKSNNPVFLLDEIDKMSHDLRGDPASALLEVLDPEQNSTFNDHYLDLDYDLSEVMFITTANTIHSIPYPLLDRMEIIRIPGYTEIEKIKIAEDFLIPKETEAHGLKKENISISDGALQTIIQHYTREAGVRTLEREIASICRKVAKEVVKKGRVHSVKILSSSVPKYLGVPKFRFSSAAEKDRIGVTTGLAWTEHGGDLLEIEVTVMPGKGKLIITGKLGDVMQESAQAALSFVRSRADELGLEKDFYQKVDLHVHVPEGAIPKDGPSAGITIATSIASALLKRPVRGDIAMTGEITLQGRILPIGGLKEKLLAAHRGNIKKAIVPKDNEKDMKEIPAYIFKSLKVHFAESMDEVLRKAIVFDGAADIFARKEDTVKTHFQEGMETEITKH
jgi:ATP-dependent Lon protease